MPQGDRCSWGHSLAGGDKLDFLGRLVKGKDDWSCHSYIDVEKESMVCFDWTLKINISHASESLRNLQERNSIRFSLLTKPHTSVSFFSEYSWVREKK